VHERREGEGGPSRRTVAEYVEQKRAREARGGQELPIPGAEWSFVPTVGTVVHAPMGKCTTCDAYARHIRDSLLGGEYQEARKTMVNDFTSRLKVERDLMSAQLRTTQLERDAAVSRGQDLEKQIAILRDDRNSFRDTMLLHRQQLKEMEDEADRPDKKRARRSSRERTPPAAQTERRPPTPPRIPRSPRQEMAADQRPSRDKGKGRAIEPPRPLPRMTGPGYDSCDDDDGSDWDDGPLAYSNSKEALEFRANEARRIEEYRARVAAGGEGWVPPTPPPASAELARERQMTKAEIQARKNRMKAAAKAEAAREYAAARQQPSTSAQGGSRPPLHQRIQQGWMDDTTQEGRGGRTGNSAFQRYRRGQPLPTTIPQWRELQTQFMQPGNEEALDTATRLVTLLQNKNWGGTPEFRMQVLREWARPRWAGPRKQHPMAPFRPATNAPVINQPHIDDPPETWAYWLWHHPRQGAEYHGIRYMANGMDLRTIRGHQLVSRYAPKGVVGNTGVRIEFQRRAAMMIARPGRYRQLCQERGRMPAQVVRRVRFPAEPPEGVTEQAVAEWFADSGVSFEEVDDAWSFASGWMEAQAARIGNTVAQADYDWLMQQQSPLNDPAVGHAMDPWYPPEGDPVPLAAPPTPPPAYVGDAGMSGADDTPEFTDYTPSSRPSDWATDVEAELASGRSEVRIHVAGSGLHRPPPRPEHAMEVPSGDVEMDAGDHVDQEDAVSLGTRVTSPDNAWSDGCYE
jgi:hypothetical protein